VTSLLGLPFVEVGTRLLSSVAAFLVIDLVLVGLFLVPRVADAAVIKLVPRKMQGLQAGVSATVLVLRQTLRNKRLFLQVAACSVLFQVLVAAVNACLFKAMGVDVGLAQCIIYTPMIFTVTMLPVSLSGLGVREAAYWYFFSQAGVSQSDAVAASLAFFVLVGLASLPGAVLFARKRGLSRKTGASPTRGGSQW
jgi:uncharacterized membrane protein YbhN (UPF0104 family)